MTLKISNATAALACNTLVDAIDVGPAVAHLVIYSGTVPADLSVNISSQVALVTYNLPEPAFGDAAIVVGGATATAAAIPSATAAADGTATFFRIFNGNGEAVIQGGITATNGGGDLELSSTSILQNIEVIVVSLTASMPNG